MLFDEVVGVGREVLPIYVDSSYLYLAVDTGDGYGRIYRYGLGSGELEEVWSGEGARFSEAVFDRIGNRVVVVGLARDSGGVHRSAVFVFDPNTGDVDVAIHPNTDEINMFRSVVYDHVFRRFIVGERGYGVDASSSHSNWPNGGGLWTIPYRGLLDYTTWIRVHEFPNNPEVTSISAHTDARAYVGLWRAGSVSRVVASSLLSLTSWSDDDIGYNVNIKHAVDVEGRIRIRPRVISDGSSRVHWFVAEIANSISLGSVSGAVRSVVVKGVGRYIVVAVGKPSLMTSDVYIVDTANRTFSVVAGDVSGLIDGRRFLYDGRRSLYIGSVNSVGNAKVYRLSFDHGRVLTLSVSPSVVRVGGTVTLTATLSDENGNPVAGVPVDFFVAHSVGSSLGGHLIGTRNTNSSGVASITYTAPTSPARLMFFAIYHA